MWADRDFLLFHSGSLCSPTVGAVSQPPRRPALAILRKPASGTSTFPIRNALTISAKRLQSGRKHSFVIVDALCPCPTSSRRHVFCTNCPRCVILGRVSKPLRLFSSLPPHQNGSSKRNYAGALSHALWALLPVQQSLHLLLTMSDNRANRVSQRQMGNRWPYQL
jgi:hypothetical protein